nr:hypothetical protein [Tanacetum cinerariifolium]
MFWWSDVGQSTRRASTSRKARITQSSALPTVAAKPASPVRDVSEGEACPTNSGFIADQDRATIVKSSTLPHESTPRVTSPAADEGSMKHTNFELMALCTSLQRQYSKLQAKFQAQEEEIVKVLEDREDAAAIQSRDDAPIKGRSINEGEAAAKRISNDLEEIARVLTSMDAATVLPRGIDVPTGSGFIPTAGPPATVISTGSEVGPTASLIVTRRKGKDVMVESDTPKKKKLQEQIDAQVEDFISMGSKEETKRLKRKEWKLYDLSRVHHVTTKDKEIFMLVEKDYPLRKDPDLGFQQVIKYCSSTPDLIFSWSLGGDGGRVVAAVLMGLKVVECAARGLVDRVDRVARSVLELGRRWWPAAATMAEGGAVGGEGGEVVTTAVTAITVAQVPKASAPRRRKGVVIQDPEETAIASVIVHSKVKSKDKGKGILIEEPKPLKRQTQIKQDEAFARQLEAELNANINWNDVLEQHYNLNQAFLERVEEEITGQKEEGNKRKGDRLNQDAAKK